ncbi:MAG: carboxypeptidase M32, partial [Bellilinea sp.]
MKEKLAAFKAEMGEIWDLYMASSLLGWDQQTYMPPNGAVERSEQLATLSKLAHIKSTTPEVGEALEELKKYAETLDPDSNDARFIRRAKIEYDKATRVPAEKVAEYARVTALAQEKWVQARAKSDFSIFRPHLERIVELRREYADYFKPYDHVYDPLLDDFEPGLKTAEVKGIFARLRPQQVELVKEIASRPQVEDDFLHLKYEDQKQWDFGVDVITRFGYNWEG